MTTLMRCCCLVIVGCAVLWTAGCNHDRSKPHELGDVSDARTPIRLPVEIDRAHREVMMQHLGTVQAVSEALAGENYEQAKSLVEAHLGFFARRNVAARHKMEEVPPAYRALAWAHVQAGKELAAIMPSRDMKQIMPRFNEMLKTCMACHQEFRSEGVRSR